MYKQASQLKLRIPTGNGNLSVEMLWGLSLTALGTVVRNMKAELGKGSEDDELSFLNDDAVPADPKVELRFNIVKDIYLTKKAEADARKNVAANKMHNQQIMTLIKAKQEEALGTKSIEELEKMLVK